MAIVVCLINMKGGVGKTTLAAQLAHAADQLDIRTLAIDLDPQANLSQSLLSEQKYRKLLDQRKPTVMHLFEDYFPPAQGSTAPRRFDVSKIILKQAGFWKDTTLDLIPSRLELSHTLKNPTGKERRLAKALSKVEDQYELILIDCAPTESILTEAAYHASRWVLVPVKPEFLATIGLPLLKQSIENFKADNDDHELDICGIVFNHCSSYSKGPEGQVSMREVKREAAKHGWHLFETHMPYSASYARAARAGTPLEKTSHARSNVKGEFKKLFQEFQNAIGLPEVKP